MNLYDYERSKEIAKEETLFETLIMAAAWGADISDFRKLRFVFPKIIKEMEEMYLSDDSSSQTSGNFKPKS